MGKSYKRARREEYPEIGDQFDALWKVVKALQSNNLGKNSKAQALLDQIDAVKSRHPKPQKRG